MAQAQTDALLACTLSVHPVPCPLICAFVNVAKVKNFSFFIIEYYGKLPESGPKTTVSQEWGV